MGTIRQIAIYFTSIGDWFELLYDEVAGWIWPFSYLATPFWWMWLYFRGIGELFTEFHRWLGEKIELIETLLTWESIKALILEWLPGIEDALEWFDDWWTSVKAKVEEWWEPILEDIKGLLTIASEALEELITGVSDALDTLKTTFDTFITDTFTALSDAFDTLKTKWDTFTATILPTLAKLTDVDDLIISKLKEWFPFYDDLDELWEEIKAFFVDPLEWLWGKFTDWFLGPEV